VKVIPTKLPGAVVLKPKAYGDEPGFFIGASGGFERAALRGDRHTRGLLLLRPGQPHLLCKGRAEGCADGCAAQTTLPEPQRPGQARLRVVV
jgi:hypothetical protein